MIDTVLPLPAAMILGALTLAYTPSDSRLRPVVGLAIIVMNWIAAHSTVAQWFPGYIGPEYILGWILGCNSWLNLARLQYVPTAQSQNQPHARLKWAIYQIFDARWGVSAAQTPFFDKDHPDWVPSREFFLLWKLWTISWTGVLTYAIKVFEPLQIEDLFAIPPGFLYRLGEVSSREMALRVYYGISVAVQSYCCLCLMHAVCGLLAVGLFKDDPAGWRPLHGSPLEAWSVRNFYHKFWHQVMRKGFTTHSGLLVNTILGLPRKNIVSRYLIAVVTFLLSGLYHAALTPGMPWQCSSLQINHQMKILGIIILEDVMGALWKKLIVQAPSSKSKHIQEQGDVSDAQTYALNSGSTLTQDKLRRRIGKSETVDEVNVSTSTTPTSDNVYKQKNKRGLPVLQMIGYLWTACVMIWLNSTLVFGTNQCVIDHTLSSTAFTFLDENGLLQTI